MGEDNSTEERKIKGSSSSSGSGNGNGFGSGNGTARATTPGINKPSPTAGVSGTSGAKIPVAAENDAKRHERLLVVYAPLVGQRVTVFLYDGAVFEGTLDSFETEKSKNEFALILRMATMLRPGREVIDASIKAGKTFELMNIRFDDMAELKSAASSSSKSGGIGTDSAISKKKGDFGKERELHRWLPEEGSLNGTLPSLTTAPGSSTTWDQFATNEKLFGLKTDFDEEMYTTKLDRTSAHVKANEATAERIAKEISSASSGGNVHVAEERGHEIEGDEESLYGAVIRSSDSPTTATLPPGFTSTSKPSTPIPSTLNPSAPEFKLNVDAPEFKPSSSKVTYYNQPRRNLVNYGGVGYYGGYGYPQNVPYYYVPPPVTTEPVPASTEMNPNAADFVMPQYYPPAAPYYGNGYASYGYNNGNGYYYNNNNQQHQ